MLDRCWWTVLEWAIGSLSAVRTLFKLAPGVGDGKQRLAVSKQHKLTAILFPPKLRQPKLSDEALGLYEAFGMRK
jgi:hypothetical protein